MSVDLKKRTAYFIRDLHAREAMRLGWYRQLWINQERIRYLRERKASHSAFLRDLLRRRGLAPAWYARPFYLIGHFFGLISALLPERLVDMIEDTLESWILIRYEEYLRKMQLDMNLRSMIESIQLKRFAHDEPGADVLDLLEEIISEEKKLIGQRA